MLRSGRRLLRVYYSLPCGSSRELISCRNFCEKRIIPESDDESVGKIPPPPHPTPHHPPFEWTYPIIVGAIGGLISAGFYYLFLRKSENEQPNDTSGRGNSVALPEGNDTLASELVESDDIPIDAPPVSPMQVVNSFPYLPEDTRELEYTFRYAGTFCIALGPKDFNRYHLVNDYLSDNRHAIVFAVRPRSYSSTLFRTTTTAEKKSGRIRELLRNSLCATVDFGLVPMIEQVGGDVLEQLSQLIQQRGPSSDQFIWIDDFDMILDYIDSIEDPVVKEQEQADFKCLLNWLIDMSLNREWSQVLIQSTDPFLLSRLETYMPLRSSPDIRKISFGERSLEDMEQTLSRLLIINEVCMTDDDIEFVLKNLGGSAPVLENAVKLLLAGHSLQTIVDTQVRPLVVGLETLLLESPYRVALWELMEYLVANFEETGQMFVPGKFVNYSPSAKETFAAAWKDLEDFFFYYENPTLEMSRHEQGSSLPSGYIAATSMRSMTACSKLVHDPDLKRVMWNEKKKIRSSDSVTFFEST